MPSVNLTTVATAAVQFLQAIDSGETLSAQQLTDARLAANNLIESWYQEQVLSLQVLLSLYVLAGGTYTPAAVPSFPDNTTAISFPLAYIRALELNLALELSGQYVTPPSQALIKQAAEARIAAMPVKLNVAFAQKTDQAGEP